MEKFDEWKYYAKKQGKGIGESGEVYIAGSSPCSRSRPEALPPFFSRSSFSVTTQEGATADLSNLIPNDMLHLTFHPPACENFGNIRVQFVAASFFGLACACSIYNPAVAGLAPGITVL